MIKLKILVLTLLITLESNAQKINFTHELKLSFQFINKAELSICKNNFTAAVMFYDSAFALIKQPDLKDLHNKALCLKKNGNNEVADSIFNFLAKKGYYKIIMHCSGNGDLSVQQSESVKLKNGEELNEVLEKIYQEDQSANMNRYSDMENYYRVVKGNIEKIMVLQTEIEDLFRQDVENKLWLPITHYFQFTGIINRIKDDKAFLNERPEYSFLENITQDYSFQNFLMEQVALANYERSAYAELLSNSGKSFGFHAVSQFDEHIIVRYPNVICPEDLEEINSNREKYGMESYEDYFAKARYTDSLITDGRPFEIIDFDGYDKMINGFYNNCYFQIVGNYRNMMGFTKPEDAKNVYERALRSLCK